MIINDELHTQFMLHYYHETYDFKCTNITKFKNHIKRYNSSCVAPSEPVSSIHREIRLRGTKPSRLF